MTRDPSYGLHIGVPNGWKLGRLAAVVAVSLLGVGASSAAADTNPCPSGWAWHGGTTCSMTFDSAGTDAVSVPSGVTQLNAWVQGGDGGEGIGNCVDTTGGVGGYVMGTLKVTNGEQLNAVVGGVGGASGAGGTPGGGGAAGETNACETGGGGGSFLYAPSGLLLAGGGGGGGGNEDGGTGEGGAPLDQWTAGLITSSGEYSATGDDNYCDGNSTETCPGPNDPPPNTANPQYDDPCSAVPEWDSNGDMHYVDGYQFYGTGATSDSPGKGGQNAYDGDDGQDGSGPATSSIAPGTGGTGGAGGNYIDQFGNQDYSSPGGGGGGGYYGGGGGSNGCGGGAGGDYMSPTLVSSGYVPDAEPIPGNPGFVRLSFTTGGQTISGTVSEPDGSGYPGETVTLTGTDSVTNATVDVQTQTDTEGAYSFTVDPGSYTVTPAQPSVPGDGQILVTSCSGTQQPQACQITLGQGQSGTANFRRSTLIVTSTQNGTDAATVSEGDCDLTPTGAAQTCTLPQAIEIANGRPGSVIGFNIQAGGGNSFDGSVPQVQDTSGTGMPQITAPTTIDGTSQPGAGKVELSGTVNLSSATYGLVVGSGGAGSTIKGMVINGYQEMVDLRGGGVTVQGDWLGTDPSGTAADPLPLGANPNPLLPVAQVGIRVESSGNQIGGPGSGQGNVVASSYTEYPGANVQPPVSTYGLVGAGDIYDTAGGNVIQGNAVGIAPGGAPLIDPPPANWKVSGEPVQLGLVSTGADTIGGSAAGDGNVIAGGGDAGSGSVVQGDTFTDGGLDRAGGLDVGAFDAAGAVTVGGATATPGSGAGNTFEAVDPTTVELNAGDGAVIQGNVFRDDTWGAIGSDGANVTIGGNSANLGNLIENNGFNESPATVEGLPAGSPPGLHSAGVRVVPGSNALIENNTFENNLGGGAVGIVGGSGTTVTDNVMTGNSFGISFDGDFYLDGQSPPQQVNDDQPYPVIRSADERSGATRLTGLYKEPGLFHAAHSVTVDLYAMKSCPKGTAQQGELFLGSRTLSAGGAVTGFNLTFDPLPAGAGFDAVTATATAPDGSTSEFSPCFTIGSTPRRFFKVGVAPTNGTVAITPSSSPSAAADATAGAATHGRGHGTLLLFCPGSAVEYCRVRFTLRTTGAGAKTLARGVFTAVPGYVHSINLTLAGKLLAKLEREHRLRVTLATDARDAAKHHNEQSRKITVTLLYK